jgi:hypothetical protein
MRSLNVFIRLAFFVLPVLASEGLLPVKRAEGEVVKDSYIITLKDGCDVSNVAGSMPDMDITHRWSKAMNGFCATLTEDQLNEIRSQPDVSAIHENAVARMSATQ